MTLNNIKCTLPNSKATFYYESIYNRVLNIYPPSKRVVTSKRKKIIEQKEILEIH